MYILDNEDRCLTDTIGERIAVKGEHEDIADGRRWRGSAARLSAVSHQGSTHLFNLFWGYVGERLIDEWEDLVQ